MRLHPTEPAFGPWRVASLATLAGDGARIVVVDGRSASGKTSLARRFAATVPGAAVVHTDDLAWYESAFHWTTLLLEGVVEPVRAERSVTFRPPAWDARGRAGAIEVPAGAPLVVIEGVGAGRAELARLVDRVIWVQADEDERQAREWARVRAGEVSASIVDEWAAEELPFLAARRPWEHADLVAAGTPTLAHEPATEVVVADPAPAGEPP